MQTEKYLIFVLNLLSPIPPKLFRVISLRKIIISPFFLLTFSLFFFYSCEKTKLPVLPESKALQLQVAEAGVTEAWLQVKMKVKEPGQQLRLYREEELVQQLSIDRDTVVYDSGLMPAHRYTYHAELWKSGTRLGKTNSVTLTTMDTTSHDFQWEVITIPSPFGSGALYDVAIINENDIWAVGEIYSDSTQPWLPYNAVHWNGNKWDLKRIKTNACGGVDYPPIRTVFAFSENDILFGHIDASITHFDGINFINDCSFIQQINGSINKIWGTSTDDLYIVGNSGLIAHYNGERWQRIESGTDLPVQDIWGIKNQETGQSLILCPASKKFHSSEKKLLRILENNTVEEISWPFQDRRVNSVWFKNEYKIFICGAGMFVKNKGAGYYRFDEIPRIFMNRIRGVDINDIFVAGDFGLIAHFNGINWKLLTVFNGVDLFHSLDYKNTLAIAVGEQSGSAVIYLFR